MKKISKLLFLIVSLFLFTNVVFADGDEDKLVTNFNFDMEEDITLDKEIHASSLVFGNEVNFNGIVKGVNLIFGNNVNYTGTSDYGAIFGNNVKIMGNITTDGAIFGNNVSFTDEALIERDIVVFANTVVLSGTFNRDVKIYASKVSFEGVSIAGNVSISAGEIKIDTLSSVLGVINYNDDTVLVNDNSSLELVSYESNKEEESAWDVVLSYFEDFISYLLVLAIMLIIYPKLFDRINDDKVSLNGAFKNMMTGLFALFIIPICILLLIISSFASYISIVILLIYVLLIMLSGLITSYTVGRVITDKLIKKKLSNYLVGILGIICVVLISMIPILGGIFSFISLIYGIGTLLLKFNKVRN